MTINSTKGANLVGWPLTEIGIGEDVRVAAKSLETVGYPFVIVDAATRVPPRPKPSDLDVRQWIAPNHKFDTDVVFLDAATQYRYYAFDLVRRRNLGRTIVGVCPWELPSWPKELSFVFEHVDYFWAATDYIREAFEPYFPGRISVARPAVIVPDRLHVAPDLTGSVPFRFITIFDGLSSIHRKNPFAVIDAFRSAFPSRTDVQLVVKMMNLRMDTPEAAAMTACISGDRRVVVVTDTLPQEELWALVSSCHVFVSLHRAEGFGRNIAEAMLLGRPVICSGFSGNLDFCTNDNSYLVDGEKVPVKSDNYANSEGQYWFDASVAHAAWQMLYVHQNYASAVIKARKARQLISEQHGYKAVGHQYVRLLEQMSRL